MCEKQVMDKIDTERKIFGIVKTAKTNRKNVNDDILLSSSMRRLRFIFLLLPFFRVYFKKCMASFIDFFYFIFTTRK